MKFEPTVLDVDNIKAEVQLPASGIMITFRCMSKDCVDASTLVEVSRMLPYARLRQSLLVSAGALMSAKRVAAEAIIEHRAAYRARNASRLPWLQLSFKF